MNSRFASTLRPGLLVSLKTSIRGNVKYFSQDIERDHLTEEGSRKAKWETTREVKDPAEHDEARKVQSKARSIISSVCTWSNFGLLCLQNQADDLDKAIAEARALADDFNFRARCTNVSVYVMIGRVASDDVEAVRSINSEVRDLMRDMQSGIEKFDVKAIRDAATKAKQLGQMLAPEASAKIQMAIDAARQSARKIVQAGETAAQEVDKTAIRRIMESRTMFLDLDEEGREVQAPVVTGRAIDFEPESNGGVAAAPRTQFAMEF